MPHQRTPKGGTISMSSTMENVMSAQALFGNEFAKEFISRQKAKAEGTPREIKTFDCDSMPVNRCKRCRTRTSQPSLARHCPECQLDGCYNCFGQPTFKPSGKLRDFIYVCPQCGKEIKTEKQPQVKQDAPKSTRAAPVSTKTPAARVTRQSKAFVDPDPDVRF